MSNILSNILELCGNIIYFILYLLFLSKNYIMKAIMIFFIYFMFIHEKFYHSILNEYFIFNNEIYFYIDKYIFILFIFFIITLIPILRNFVYLILANILFLFGLYSLYTLNTDKINIDLFMNKVEKYINIETLKKEKTDYIVNLNLDEFNMNYNNIYDTIFILKHNNYCLKNPFTIDEIEYLNKLK